MTFKEAGIVSIRIEKSRDGKIYTKIKYINGDVLIVERK